MNLSLSDPPRVRVTFRKGLSDGNYGTEVAEVTLEYDATPGEDQNTLAEALLAQARHLCETELRQSSSAGIRRALQPPPPVMHAKEFAN